MVDFSLPGFAPISDSMPLGTPTRLTAQSGNGYRSFIILMPVSEPLTTPSTASMILIFAKKTPEVGRCMNRRDCRDDLFGITAKDNSRGDSKASSQSRGISMEASLCSGFDLHLKLARLLIPNSFDRSRSVPVGSRPRQIELSPREGEW